jgi:pentatricopeptide repeat protein
MVATSIFV